MKRIKEKRPQFRGDILRTIRKKSGMTLQQLADKCSSSKSYIWECECSDVLEPSGSHVFKLAHALKCKMEDFYK